MIELNGITASQDNRRNKKGREGINKLEQTYSFKYV
jgi:hypothetical protein